MGIVLYSLTRFLLSLMDCVEYILIGYILMGWLIIFGIIKNSANPVMKAYFFLMTQIEPILAIVRRFVPPIFGLDFSPMVVFFALHLIKVLIYQIAMML